MSTYTRKSKTKRNHNNTETNQKLDSAKISCNRLNFLDTLQLLTIIFYTQRQQINYDDTVHTISIPVAKGSVVSILLCRAGGLHSAILS